MFVCVGGWNCFKFIIMHKGVSSNREVVAETPMAMPKKRKQSSLQYVWSPGTAKPSPEQAHTYKKDQQYHTSEANLRDFYKHVHLMDVFEHPCMFV